MPQTTYTEQEVAVAIRVAYATGVRDTLITFQHTPLSEEQSKSLVPFVLKHKPLAETVKDILKTTAELVWTELRTRQRGSPELRL